MVQRQNAYTSLFFQIKREGIFTDKIIKMKGKISDLTEIMMIYFIYL